jgi:hypothetical protein
MLARRYPQPMPGNQDDEVAWGHGGSRPGHSVLLAAGLALAVVATIGAFVTDDPRYLRLAVVAAAWAFVAAAFAASRRRAEQQAAAGREAEMRRAFDRELDLEVAARREFELELENDLRREAEEVVRSEVAALRGDIATLDRVREEIARVAAAADDPAALSALGADVSALRSDVASLAALRTDVAALTALRGEVAALSSLRGDVAALGPLRNDLGQLADLRAEVGRLRADIVEQLDGEMLVERIIMRTQATRRPSDSAPAAAQASTADDRAADPGAHLTAASISWAEEPSSRELTGGWPQFRLDDPGPTREYETVRPVRSRAAARSEPRTATFSFTPSPPPGGSASRAPTPLERLVDRSLLDADLPPVTGRSRHAAAEPDTSPPAPGPRTFEPRAAVPPAAAPPASAPTAENPYAPVRPVPYRRRRSDDADAGPRKDPAEAVTAERPTAVPAIDDVRPEPARGADGFVRVSEIVAGSGTAPPSGGRRRRRYREDDEQDDVLARVLGLQ